MEAAATNDIPLLRHTVATLAYRAAKALRGAPETFAHFKAGDSTRTPLRIVAHMGDLFDWALSIANGKETWHNATPLAWDEECRRFFAALEAFDRCLAHTETLGLAPARLFQGPIADALTHVGQLAMLRRLAGSPIRGEDYSLPHIESGRVGADQPPAVHEFN